MLQIIVGLLLLPIIMFFTFLIFGILTLIVNVPALAIAKLLRRIVGAKGTWVFGAAIGAILVVVGKVAATLLVPASAFTYAVIPGGESASSVMVTLAVAALILVWMPGVFFVALFARADDLADLGT